MVINTLTVTGLRLLALGLWGGAIACATPNPPPAPITSNPVPDQTLVPPPGPPPPPADAFLAVLTPDHMAQLKTLGVPVIIPTAIPEGFSVAQISLAGSFDRDQGDSIW